MRAALGFREPTVEDEDRLATWLAQELCPVELADERLRERSWRGVAPTASSRRAGSIAFSGALEGGARDADDRRDHPIAPLEEVGEAAL